MCPVSGFVPPGRPSPGPQVCVLYEGVEIRSNEISVLDAASWLASCSPLVAPQLKGLVLHTFELSVWTLKLQTVWFHLTSLKWSWLVANLNFNVWVIPLKITTPESKFYISPSRIVIKSGIHRPHNQTSLPIFFISVKGFLKYKVLKNHPPHLDQKGTCARFLFNNHFDNALRETFYGSL